MADPAVNPKVGISHFMDGFIDFEEARFIEQYASAAEMMPSKKADAEKSRFDNPDEERKEQLKKHVSHLVLTILWTASALFCGLVLVSFYHLVVDPAWHWLDGQALHTISDLITHVATGAGGVFLGKYFKRAFPDLEISGSKQ